MTTTKVRAPSLQGLFWCVFPIDTDRREARDRATLKALEAGHENVREVRFHEHLIQAHEEEEWWVVVATVEVG